MPAVTLDLWHTLMYLPPEDEEAYMTHQLAIGQEVLRASPPLAGVPDLSDAELGRAFERAYVRAVAESADVFGHDLDHLTGTAHLTGALSPIWKRR